MLLTPIILEYNSSRVLICTIIENLNHQYLVNSCYLDNSLECIKNFINIGSIPQRDYPRYNHDVSGMEKISLDDTSTAAFPAVPGANPGHLIAG